ncbi:hypothetical protein FH972_023452 [Carpinus fangiana]|uniref:Fructose-bisphosphate aldolase n=1 Tax=Carpinus fangiana TaxID=176857 RepID=A0A5N6KV82_9ROSI|nr:hypothetical protein FH972_023452 [Carpinus fangiana]
MTTGQLKDNKSLAILNAARDGGYAVPGMCSYNLEAIIATVRAAEAAKSPAMILLFPWAIEYAGSVLVHAAAEAARSASVPISVHLDHCQTPELVRRAADIPHGFDSIMCDMSHYEKAENLALTRELVAYCHARGIATEAEPGRIEGGEDGVAATADLEGVLTTPAQAREFVDTGIGMLAPAFGNVHGNYGPRGVQLEYERLEAINREVGGEVRLVLHGADPFTEEIFQRCIRAGVSKVNINKGMNAHYAAVQQQMQGKPLTSVIEAGTDAMQKAIEEYMRQLGSAGKAHAMKIQKPLIITMALVACVRQLLLHMDRRFDKGSPQVAWSLPKRVTTIEAAGTLRSWQCCPMDRTAASEDVASLLSLPGGSSDRQIHLIRQTWPLPRLPLERLHQDAGMWGLQVPTRVEAHHYQRVRRLVKGPIADATPRRSSTSPHPLVPTPDFNSFGTLAARSVMDRGGPPSCRATAAPLERGT